MAESARPVSIIRQLLSARRRAGAASDDTKSRSAITHVYLIVLPHYRHERYR